MLWQSHSENFSNFLESVEGDGDAAVDRLASASCHGVAWQSGDGSFIEEGSLWNHEMSFYAMVCPPGAMSWRF